MQILPYNREAAVAYAHKWAYGSNPQYFNFNNIGGDCTNFASQCIYAGSKVMNYTPVYGWFYRSAADRTASWTGVQYLYNFLTANKGPGPFASDTDLKSLEPGDIVQLSFGGSRFEHTPVIVRIDGTPTLETVFVAAHTYNSDYRPLASYDIWKMRCLHIEGVRH